MMKILIDEMPSSRDACPYYKESFRCTYRQECVCTCCGDDMEECKYFMDIRSALRKCTDTLEDTLDGIFEPVPYDLRHPCGYGY